MRDSHLLRLLDLCTEEKIEGTFKSLADMRLGSRNEKKYEEKRKTRKRVIYMKKLFAMQCVELSKTIFTYWSVIDRVMAEMRSVMYFQVETCVVGAPHCKLKVKPQHT